MHLIFDTETTGLPRDFKAPITDTSNWPRVVQIAWQLHDEMGNLMDQRDFLIHPSLFFCKILRNCQPSGSWVHRNLCNVQANHFR